MSSFTGMIVLKDGKRFPLRLGSGYSTSQDAILDIAVGGVARRLRNEGEDLTGAVFYLYGDDENQLSLPG